MNSKQWAPILVLIVLLVPCRGARAQDAMTTVKTLYASAAYEEALTAIDRARASTPAITDTQGLNEYRAFCLLALGREADATRALEELIRSNPFFAPDSASVSPRVRTLFISVRQRLLPGLAQLNYGAAKAAYDRKDYQAAADQFAIAVKLIDDPDVHDATGLADLRTLAAGFLELARAAAAPPPPPPPAADSAPATPAPPPAKAFYDAGDVDVVPPVILRQDFPSWLPAPAVVSAPIKPGVVEVLIDETGRVVQATLRQTMSPLYDRQLLSATTAWRYKPALKGGVPVKYRKMIQVNVDHK